MSKKRTNNCQLFKLLFLALLAFVLGFSSCAEKREPPEETQSPKTTNSSAKTEESPKKEDIHFRGDIDFDEILRVEKEQTLTIHAGANVAFHKGSSIIVAGGALRILGLHNNPVFIEASETGKRVIYASKGASIVMNNCRFSCSKRNQGSSHIDIRDSRMIASHLSFDGVRSSSSLLNLSGNTFARLSHLEFKDCPVHYNVSSFHDANVQINHCNIWNSDSSTPGGIDLNSKDTLINNLSFKGNFRANNLARIRASVLLNSTISGSAYIYGVNQIISCNFTFCKFSFWDGCEMQILDSHIGQPIFGFPSFLKMYRVKENDYLVSGSTIKLDITRQKHKSGINWQIYSLGESVMNAIRHFLGHNDNRIFITVREHQRNEWGYQLITEELAKYGLKPGKLAENTFEVFRKDQ